MVEVIDNALLVITNLPLVNTYPHAQMDALTDRTRRAIVERLLNGPVAVGDLARDFPVSRPAISQHLKVLKRAHLVIDRPHGTRRYYELNPAGVEALRQYFERFWSDALAQFKQAAERQHSDR